MRAGFLLLLCLAGCVETGIPDSERPDGLMAGTPIEVDGMTLVARQMRDWPSMIAPVDPATGKMVFVQSGTADTVVMSGSADSRDRAIRALASFCNRPDITSAGFDTQVVYQEPASGDWWFDGFLCEA
jgi:hypothetical protein